MNSVGDKRSFAWILCPSKSFPGKLYYFNVFTGETLWTSDGDVEKQMLKNHINRVADKWHVYPEPDSPPLDLTPSMPKGNPWPPKTMAHPLSRPYNQYPMPSLMEQPRNDHSFHPPNMWTSKQFKQPASSIMRRPIFDASQSWGQYRDVPNPNLAKSRYFMDDRTSRLRENPFDLSRYEPSAPMKWVQEDPFQQRERRMPYSQMPTFGSFQKQNRPAEMHKRAATTFCEPPPMKRVRTVSDSSIADYNNAPLGFSRFADTERQSQRQHKLNLSNSLEDLSIYEYHDPPTRKSNDNIFGERTPHCNPFTQSSNFNTFQRQPFTKRMRTFSDTCIADRNDTPFSNYPRVNDVQKTRFTDQLPRVSWFGSNFHEDNNMPSFKCPDIPMRTSGSGHYIKPPQSEFAQLNKVRPVDGYYQVSQAQKLRPCDNRPFQEAKISDKPKSIFSPTYNTVSVQNRGSDVPRTSVESADSAFSKYKSRKGDKTSEERADLPFLAFKTGQKTLPTRKCETKTSSDSENVCRKEPTSRSNDMTGNRRIAQKGNEISGNESNTLKGKDSEKPEANSEKEPKADLDNDDLRYKLRKIKEKRDKKEVISLKPKPSDSRNRTRKRVTFQPEVEDLELEFDDQDGPLDFNQTGSVIDYLRSLASAPVEVWYIVVDTDVLLEGFDFVDTFVQTDPSCRLVIPQAVHAALPALAGGAGARRRVLAARSLIRRLARVGDHVVVQQLEQPEPENTTVEESILLCCIQTLEDEQHVIFLTSNEELCEKAISMGIHSIKLEGLKDNVAAEQSEDLFYVDTIGNSEQKDRTWTPKNVTERTSKKKDPPQKGRNKSNPQLFLRNKHVNLTENHVILQRNSSNIKIFTDSENGNGNFFFSAKSQTLPNEVSFDKAKSISPLELVPHMKLLTVEDKSGNTDPVETGEGSNDRVSNIDEVLKGLHVDNKFAEYKVRARMEEWICTFTQIMEETLTEVLQTSSTTSPWTLMEAVKAVKKTCKENPASQVAGRLYGMLVKCCCKKGKLKPSTPPNDFLRIVYCGKMLIECMTGGLPSRGAAAALRRLLAAVRAPPASDSPDISPEARKGTGGQGAPRTNFVKQPAEILYYLQKHFPDWRSHELGRGVPVEPIDNPIVFRSKGKNINLITIDKNKTLTLNHDNDIGVINFDKTDETRTDINTKMRINETDININKDETFKEPVKESGAKKLRRLALNSGQNKKKPKDIDLAKREKLNKELTAIIDNIVHGNVATTKPYIPPKEDKIAKADEVNKATEAKPSCPKVAFRLKPSNKRPAYALEKDAPKPCTKVKIVRKKKVQETKKDEIAPDNKKTKGKTVTKKKKVANNKKTAKPKIVDKIDHGKEINNNLCANEVDTANDSGIENDSVYAYDTAKTFLVELSRTFIDIYEFIHSFVLECGRQDFSELRRQQLAIKAKRTHDHLTEIILNLKGIIQRESGEGVTLKLMLSRAGREARDDVRMNRYKQIVTKCLEQAHILERSLRRVICSVCCDGGLCAPPSEHTIQYYNIFE